MVPPIRWRPYAAKPAGRKGLRIGRPVCSNAPLSAAARAGCRCAYTATACRPLASKQRADVLARRARARAEPRARARADPGRQGVVRHAPHRQGRRPARCRGRPLAVRGEDHPVCLARRGQARRRARRVRGSTRAARSRPTSARRPAASPIACCSAARARVYAIDVGRGQLHDKLRRDPRVRRDGARATRATCSAGDLPEPLDWVVIDASFIGLAKLLPAARALLAPGRNRGGAGQAAVRGRARAGRQGRRGARRAGARRRDRAGRSATPRRSASSSRGQADAVLAGPAGNLECFLWLGRVTTAAGPPRRLR